MENFEGISVGDRLRITGGNYSQDPDNGWHYLAHGSEVEVTNSDYYGQVLVSPLDPSAWLGSSGYSVADTNSVRAQDVERVATGVLLDDQWRPPVGTTVVITAQGVDDHYHSLPLGTEAVVTRLRNTDRITVEGMTTYGYRDSQHLRPGDYRLPDGVEAILPPAPADELEAFKRKVVTDALARRVRFGLDHGNMIDFLTNDLGLGEFLPPVKVQVVMEVEVRPGSTAEVRERAEAAVRSGEGILQGRPAVIG